MWKPLLSAGLGVPGAAVSAPTLPDDLMRVLEAARSAPSVALRACDVGFALNIAAQLRETSVTDSMLQRLLAVGHSKLHLKSSTVEPTILAVPHL